MAGTTYLSKGGRDVPSNDLRVPRRHLRCKIGEKGLPALVLVAYGDCVGSSSERLAATLVLDYWGGSCVELIGTGC